VVTALKSKHPGAAGIFAHQLEGVLYGLGTAYVKMNAAFKTEAFLDALHNALRELDLFTVKILASQLREFIDLALESFIDPGIPVTQVHGGIPHLKIQIRFPRHVVEVTAFTAVEDLGPLGIMHRIAVRTDFPLNSEERLFIS